MEPEIQKGASNFNASAYHVMVCWEALIKQDYIIAKTHAEICLEYSLELQATLPLASAYHAAAQVFHELGEHKRSDELLRKAYEVSFRMKSTFLEFMCRIAEAQFALDRGCDKNAILLLRKAFMLGKEKNYANFFLWRSNVMVRICLFALQNRIETVYVKCIIRKRELSPETPPYEIKEWPWQLKIYTLGQFSMEKDGIVMQFAGKSPKKPISLLKALITFGSKGANEYQLEDMLWPDADGDAAHNAFHVTLKRLRELIGIDGIITLREGVVTINPNLCWVDAWASERLANKK